jgi:hypothetical protein
MTKHYIAAIPSLLEEGARLVHNHVIPQRTLGLNGFRAWIQNEDGSLEVCRCDWAGVDLHGLAHYRVKKK